MVKPSLQNTRQLSDPMADEAERKSSGRSLSDVEASRLADDVRAALLTVNSALTAAHRAGLEVEISQVGSYAGGREVAVEIRKPV